MATHRYTSREPIPVEALLASPRAAAALAFAYFIAAVLVGPHFLHDEGLFTFDFARALSSEFASVFFFHKAKPVLVLLYALPARLGGLHGYLWAHAAFAALAVYLAARSASFLGAAWPNIASLTMITAVAYLVTGANGIPNVDGAVALTIYVYLTLSGKRRAAAVVLGLLPFVRNELLPSAALFFAVDLLRVLRTDQRPWRNAAARIALTATFPLAYAIAGAVYHGDLLWLPHLAVNPNTLPLAAKDWVPPQPSEFPAYALRSYSLHAPLLSGFVVLGMLRALRHRHHPALVLSAVVCLIYGLITLLQITQLHGTNLSLRYHVLGLPLVAILAAYGLSRPSEELGKETRATGPTRRGSRVPLALVLLVLGNLIIQGASLTNADLHFSWQHRETHAIMETLRARGIYRGQALFTDIYAARFDDCAGIREASLLANDAMVFELNAGITHESGQREGIYRALHEQGFVLSPGEHEIRKDAIYIIDDHSRMAPWRALIDAAEPTNLRIRNRIVSYWPPTDTP